MANTHVAISVITGCGSVLLSVGTLIADFEFSLVGLPMLFAFLYSGERVKEISKLNRQIKSQLDDINEHQIYKKTLLIS
jgi:hypothetical protein